MKLVMVGPYPIVPSIITGGVEAVIVYLLEGFKQFDDLEIDVVSIRKEIKSEKTQQYDNFKVHYLPSSQRFGNMTFEIVNKLKTLKKIEELKPDLIHIHNHANYPFISNKPFCPTITTVHGITYKEVLYENEKLDWIRKFPRIFLEKMVLKKANYLISVTSYVKDMIRHLTKGRIYTVSNPVSRRFFNITNKEIANRILFVGSILKRKNILDLIKAVKILHNEIPTIELRIAGIDEEQYYYSILKNYIFNNNLIKNVNFLGQLSDDQLHEEYSRCSIFALTSFEETSGMVIQQAMAAGKPVIATRVGGIPYVIEDRVTGLLIGLGNPKELADKIKLLLKDEGLRLKLGRRARKEAIKKFKPEVVARETYNVYKEVINFENRLITQ